jgi:diaminopimelate decarboxylase
VSRFTADISRPPAFTYRSTKQFPEQVLCCEELPLHQLARRFGTPLYVYSATTLRERARSFDRAFRSIPHTICYSVKANSNLSVLRLLSRVGCGFDVVSAGELQRVLKAAPRSAGKIVFSGVGKMEDEISAAIHAGILLFNVESESELGVLARCAARARARVNFAFRVNPDVPAKTHPYISTGLHRHKFGIPIAQASALYRTASAKSYLNAVGVSVHIGSQITEMGPFSAAMERVAKLVIQLRRNGHRIQYVDAGGGLGIHYERPGAPDFEKRVCRYADAIMKHLAKLNVHLLLEPGRAIAGPAGVLVARVLYRKNNHGNTFLVLDAAMNDLIRPALYNAYHDVVPVNYRASTPRERVDVVGPICETGDFFARERKLPLTAEGDLVAILDAGAYGMTLASNYNTRARAPEVLVEGKSAKLIRRRETVDDLLKLELISG